ncbi:hypothetical protein KCP71_02830 [Salmonella enterica subsp. enterica]|nr:hypothetical protein KCP71_02830 [Salmonella enterica subsp. enterica]
MASSLGIWPKPALKVRWSTARKVGQPMLVQVIVPYEKPLPIKHRERLTSGGGSSLPGNHMSIMTFPKQCQPN